MAEPWQGWSMALLGVQFYAAEDERGAQGDALYELKRPCDPGCPRGDPAWNGGNGIHSLPEERDDRSRGDPLHTEYRYLSQPFHSGGQRHYKGATPEQIAENRANIWAWNGDRAAPSITPSYLFEGHTHAKGLYPDWPRIHIYLTAGRLVNCGDSDATIVP